MTRAHSAATSVQASCGHPAPPRRSSPAPIWSLPDGLLLDILELVPPENVVQQWGMAGRLLGRASVPGVCRRWRRLAAALPLRLELGCAEAPPPPPWDDGSQLLRGLRALEQACPSFKDRVTELAIDGVLLEEAREDYIEGESWPGRRRALSLEDLPRLRWSRLRRLSCDLEAAQLLLPLCRRLKHLELDMQRSDYESVRGLCRAAARGLAAAPASLRTLRLRSGMRWLRERRLGRLQLTMWTLDVDWRSQWPALADAKHAEAILAHVSEARLGAHEGGALAAAVPGARALRGLRRLHLEAEVGGRVVGEVSGYEPHYGFTKWPLDERPASRTQQLRAPWLAALPSLQELNFRVESSASIADVPDVWSLQRLTALELAAAAAAPPPAAMALPALRRLTLRCCFAGAAAGTLPEAICGLTSLTHLAVLEPQGLQRGPFRLPQQMSQLGGLQSFMLRLHHSAPDGLDPGCLRALGPLSALRSLALCDCRLPAPPDGLPLAGLTALDLSGNEFGQPASIAGKLGTSPGVQPFLAACSSLRALTLGVMNADADDEAEEQGDVAVDAAQVPSLAGLLRLQLLRLVWRSQYGEAPTRRMKAVAAAALLAAGARESVRVAWACRGPYYDPREELPMALLPYTSTLQRWRDGADEDEEEDGEELWDDGYEDEAEEEDGGWCLQQ